MTLYSGQLPYEYDVKFPITIEQIIGPSGSLLEQSQFVILSELRKFSYDETEGLITSPFGSETGTIYTQDVDYNTVFNFYNNQINPPIPYEPSASGTTLTNPLNPASVCIDFFADIREALRDLGYKITNTEHGFWHNSIVNAGTPTGIRTVRDYISEWITRNFPNSPSGYAQFQDPSNLPDGVMISGTFLRPVPNSGKLLDSTLYFLGGSGTLLDIDFSEIIFQPWPLVRRYWNSSNFSVGRDGLGSQGMFVQTSPIFPCFQRTDGTLISLNGREPNRLNDSYHRYFSQFPDQPYCDHIASGLVRIEGYCLNQNTKFSLNNPISGFVESNNNNLIQPFVYNRGEGRRIGVTDFSSKHFVNDNSLRAYLTPSPISSGVYRVVAQWDKNITPYIAIESGVASISPRMDESYPLYPNLTAYQVFDDCFGYTSYTGEGSANGSGLALLSPFTSNFENCVWQIIAERAQGADFPKGRGLGHDKTNNFFYRHHDDKIIKYNYALDIISYFSIVQPAPDDIDFDGTSFWILNSSLEKVYQLNSTGTFLAEYDLDEGNDVSGRGFAAIDGKYYIFGRYGILPIPANRKIKRIDLANPSIIVDDKEIDLSLVNLTIPIVHTTRFDIMDLIKVTDGTHVQNGYYALVTCANAPYSAGSLLENVFILKIEETESSWLATAKWKVPAFAVDSSFQIGRKLDFCHMHY